jgi:hypothetical protein
MGSVRAAATTGVGVEKVSPETILSFLSSAAVCGPGSIVNGFHCLLTTWEEIVSVLMRRGLSHGLNRHDCPAQQSHQEQQHCLILPSSFVCPLYISLSRISIIILRSIGSSENRTVGGISQRILAAE